ncbi:MAG: TIGR03618 family F420-dependent PPOX class oxidoreductase [Actinobacteria bacterium]|nr:TIGR03618 family F420-dependent PPOX class oxidoreductase [Actinomycetota bacterium]
MSTRDRIRMSVEERLAFLAAERVAVVASLGPRGWPHSMPLWFVVREGELWSWTYGSSQKVSNLERDPRATVLVEAGDGYEELRGVMVEAEAEIEREPGRVLALGRELGERYGGGAVGPEAEAALARQARKRVAIRFRPVRTVSWDHRKLAAATNSKGD